MNDEDFFRPKIERQEMRLESAAATAACEEHPEVNEDRYLNLPADRLFAVFDGMGGVQAGEVAAERVREAVEQGLSNQPAASVDRTVMALRQILEWTSEKIWLAGLDDPELKNMGTTALVAKIIESDSGAQAVVGSIGDSRIYLLRGGQLEYLNEQDDVVLLHYLEGKIEKTEMPHYRQLLDTVDGPLGNQDPKFRLMTRQRARISQSVGGRHPDAVAHLQVVPLQPGDRLLLVSDGISDNLPHNIIQQLVSEGGDLTGVADRLVEIARLTSRTPRAENWRAKPDDMTAVVVDLK